MNDPEGKSYFEIINQIFTAPVFFFLAILMFAATGYTVWATPHNVNYIVLGCLLFIAGYNFFRLGRKFAGWGNALWR